jgi:prepilin-type N-terminal cleavage/methylation domain-containing protein
MRTDIGEPTPSGRQTGFSLIELLIVVILILILSAVALPGMFKYMRTYRVRAGAQQVASNIQAARARAIMRNVNVGVVFGIVDRDTYRMIIEDPPDSLDDADGDGWADVNEGPMFDLPTGVQFVPAAESAMRFDRMGRWCQPGTLGCPNPPAFPCSAPPRCIDEPGPYIANDGTGALIGVQDLNTGIIYQVGVTPGGRVRVKPLNDPTAAR